MRPALTPDQRRQVRSLVEDSGYTRDEAIVLVREGFADEPGPDCRDGSGWTVSMERSADGYGRERKERCACNPDPNRGGGAW